MASTTGVFELGALTVGSNRAANALPIVNVADATQAPQGSLVKTTLAGLYRTETVAVTVSTPLPDIAQTWNAGGVTFTATKVNVTDTASAAGSLLADWQVGGVSVASITKAGLITAVGVTATTVTGTSIVGTLTTAAQTNVTSLGTLTAVTVSGAATVGSLVVSTAVGKLIPGATSLSWRNHADSADNLLISDVGNATLRGTLTVAGGASLLASTASLTDGAAAQIATMTNGPTAGNPTKWIAISDAGNTRYIPCW